MGGQSVLLWLRYGSGWVPALGDSSGHLQVDVLTTTNLDVALSTLRWGTASEPAWETGAITDNPGAGTALVSKTVGASKTGQVFGLSINAPEANEFVLYEDATAKLRFALAAAGLIFISSPSPIWANVAAGVVISIKNISAATAAGKYYQARLYYKEA